MLDFVCVHSTGSPPPPSVLGRYEVGPRVGGGGMADIYVAALPFIGCAMVLVGLLILFPDIALWLPRLGTG